MNSGIFKQGYIVCTIETPGKGWAVQRKEDDFTCLRKTLMKLYPGFAIPVLPKSYLKNLDPESIDHHKVKLCHFINEILSHPLLSRSKQIRSFLNNTDEEFERSKEEFESTLPPKTVSECITIKGVASVNYDKPLTQFCHKIFDSASKLKLIFTE